MFFDFLNFIVAKIVFFCSSIGGEAFPKPLSKEEELKYLTLFRENGDPYAKEMLINHNMRLVAHIAKKYSGAEDTDDLISVGSIGLIKAINSFEPNKGTQLATYTARCIENEILMMLRANKKHKSAISLSDAIGTDKDGNELTLIEIIAEDDEGVLKKVENKILRTKFLEVISNCLTAREYRIICLRYGLKGGKPLAQREVASILKISRSYVSRIEKKTIEKIREEVKKNDFFMD